MNGLNIFRNVVAIILYIIIGLYLLITELLIVHALYGGIGVLLGIVLFPITLIVVPFFVLFKIGNWLLIILSLVGLIVPGLISTKEKKTVPQEN